MAKIIDTDGLAFFKEQQDAANEKKFVKSADIVDGNGVILADKLPANFGADVIAILERPTSATRARFFARLSTAVATELSTAAARLSTGSAATATARSADSNRDRRHD